MLITQEINDIIIACLKDNKPVFINYKNITGDGPSNTSNWSGGYTDLPAVTDEIISSVFERGSAKILDVFKLAYNQPKTVYQNPVNTSLFRRVTDQYMWEVIRDEINGGIGFILAPPGTVACFSCILYGYENIDGKAVPDGTLLRNAISQAVPSNLCVVPAPTPIQPSPSPFPPRATQPVLLPSATPTQTPTPVTPTPTVTQTNTPSVTSTTTPTSSVTNTPSQTSTITVTPTTTQTQTQTPSVSQSADIIPVTSTQTPTTTQNLTPTPSSSHDVVLLTPTPTLTPTSSNGGEVEPQISQTPTVTATPTPTVSISPEIPPYDALVTIYDCVDGEFQQIYSGLLSGRINTPLSETAAIFYAGDPVVPINCNDPPPALLPCYVTCADPNNIIQDFVPLDGSAIWFGFARGNEEALALYVAQTADMPKSFKYDTATSTVISIPSKCCDQNCCYNDPASAMEFGANIGIGYYLNNGNCTLITENDCPQNQIFVDAGCSNPISPTPTPTLTQTPTASSDVGGGSGS